MITCPKSTLTTLTQFIIVAAVAVALIAVLMPVFTTAHSNAVHNVQSRLGDLGRSLQEYSDDYDGSAPCGTFSYVIGHHHSLTGLGWAGQVYPYVKNPIDFENALGGQANDSSMGSQVAFAINENVARQFDPSTWTDRAKTVELYQVNGARAKIDELDEGDCDSVGACSPSGNGTFIMLSDGLFPRRVLPATGNLGGRPDDALVGQWPAPAVDGGSYYLLADGHVRWFKPSDVSSGNMAFNVHAPQTGTVTGCAAGVLNPFHLVTFSTK